MKNDEIQKKLDFKEAINKMLFGFASLKYWRDWIAKTESFLAYVRDGR